MDSVCGPSCIVERLSTCGAMLVRRCSPVDESVFQSSCGMSSLGERADGGIGDAGPSCAFGSLFLFIVAKERVSTTAFATGLMAFSSIRLFLAAARSTSLAPSAVDVESLPASTLAELRLDAVALVLLSLFCGSLAYNG